MAVVDNGHQQKGNCKDTGVVSVARSLMLKALNILLFGKEVVCVFIISAYLKNRMEFSFIMRLDGKYLLGQLAASKCRDA